MKVRQTFRLAIGLLLIVSIGLTLLCATDYFSALIGEAEAQWQFGSPFLLLASLLGIAALVLECLAKPVFSRRLILATTATLTIPLILFGLVVLHVY